MPASDANGPPPSRVQTRPGPWATVLDFLCSRFPAIDRAQWQDRMRRGRVTDAAGVAVGEHRPFSVGLELRYFREVAAEPAIDGEVQVIHRDAHLLVVDKPPFLPVTPGGPFVEQTVLARLRRTLGLHDLVPLHRIDRLTSGLLLLSPDADSRGRYQRLFADRRIDKTYHAIVQAPAGIELPDTRASRVVPGEPFFRMCEVADGFGVEPNSLTRIRCLRREGGLSLLELQPVTGRKHQLRVHLAALGAPVLNDPLYPQWQPAAKDDPRRPLMLLARALSYVDPLDGRPRHWQSRRWLELAAGASALLREPPDAG